MVTKKAAAKGASPAKRVVKRKVAPAGIPKVIEIKNCCGKCKFFFHQNGAAEGACRRFPATPMLAPMQGVVTVFPAMQSSGWCGEFKAKPVSIRKAKSLAK